jgi:hypothetical protein
VDRVGTNSVAVRLTPVPMLSMTSPIPSPAAEGFTMPATLKLYRAPDTFDDYDCADTSPAPTVLVAMAQRMNFVWLKDFLDDEVCVTPDLYDVLQNFRASRPHAG